ncbi:hypothetical protein ABID22_002505 [Pontibacter aydingkolensis]|nr:hypothetical protein [Pontibacter aydingkolensis]
MAEKAVSIKLPLLFLGEGWGEVIQEGGWDLYNNQNHPTPTIQA